MIDLSFDRGVNFLDTANVYTKGESETILGRILKGRRNRCVLASKVGNKTGDPPDAPPLSKRAILKQIDLTLQRLQTDYLDLYYLHLPDYGVRIEETLEALDEVVKSGKARYPAISNYAAWQVAQVFAISEKQGYAAPHVSQPMYNLLARGIEQEYVPFCKEYDVAIVVYNPLAGGLLTGKQQRERPLPGTRFDANQMYLDRYWHPAYFDAVEQVAGIAERGGSQYDRSLDQLATAPHRDRLRDSRRIENRATRAESRFIRPSAAGRGNGGGARHRLAQSPRRDAEIQPLVRA
jgi:aryl-alcohol dehydrogenase-like predicted oxidoreductase